MEAVVVMILEEYDRHRLRHFRRRHCRHHPPRHVHHPHRLRQDQRRYRLSRRGVFSDNAVVTL